MLFYCWPELCHSFYLLDRHSLFFAIDVQNAVVFLGRRSAKFLRDALAIETQADGSGPYIDVFNLECKGVISLLVLNRIGFHRHHLIDRKGGEDGGAYAAARDLPDRLRPVVDIADGLTVHGL